MFSYYQQRLVAQGGGEVDAALLQTAQPSGHVGGMKGVEYIAKFFYGIVGLGAGFRPAETVEFFIVVIFCALVYGQLRVGAVANIALRTVICRRMSGGRGRCRLFFSEENPSKRRGYDSQKEDAEDKVPHRCLCSRVDNEAGRFKVAPEGRVAFAHYFGVTGRAAPGGIAWRVLMAGIVVVAAGAGFVFSSGG